MRVMDKRYIEPVFFLVLLFGTAILAALIALPFLKTIILAAILAFLFSGVFDRLVRILRNRSLAALLTTILVLFTILVPLSLVGYRIATEASDTYSYLQQQATDGTFIQTITGIQEKLQTIFPTADIDPQVASERLQQVLSWIIGHLGPLFSGLTRLALNFLLLLLFFYYLIRDGGRLQERLMQISPLSENREREIASTIGRAINSTIRGQMVIAALQGLVAGIGFVIFGVPNAALLGSLVVLVSFIPTLGTSLVQVPVIIYLFVTNQGNPIGLALWALIAVGLLDNMLGPRLIAQGMRVHPVVMIVAVLGGIGMFGPIGVLLGPIIISFLYALIEIYLRLMRSTQKDV